VTVGVDVEILRNCPIPLADGNELSCDVYLPAATGPVPALLALLPYQKDALGGAGAWQMHHFFARHGYAVVLADFRGTGASSGRPRPPFDPGEADDGVAAIAWVAEQQWCNGAVGMWGHSYGAITAMRTAARGAPALKAILPVMGHLDSERDFVHPHGRRGFLGSLGVWGLTTLVTHLTPSLHADADGEWLRRWEERVACEPYVVELVRRNAGDERWRESVVDAAAIDVPAFCVGGWRDLFCAGTLQAYERMAGPKKLLVGPWMHTMPQDSPFAAIDFLPLALRWWDRWLCDEDNGIDTEPPVHLHADDIRSLSFTSEPLSSPLMICGRATVRVAVATEEPGEWTLVLKLADVAPDGRSLFITSGVATIAGDGTHRTTIRLDPIAYELAPGHRLRLTAGQHDFPRLWPVQGTGMTLIPGPEHTMLILPLGPAAGAREVAMPAPDGRLAGPELTVRSDSWHRTEREHFTGRLAVAMGQELTTRTPVPDVVVDMEQEVEASATPRGSLAPSIEGRCSLRARTAAGEITVRAELRVEHDGVVAGGEVALDGRLMLQRRWDTRREREEGHES
jgi:predicted acyl esterase